MIIEQFPGISQLSGAEQRQLAEELLQNLHASPPDPEGADAKTLQELRVRYDAHQAGDDSGKPWDEVKSSLKQETGASWQS